MGSFYSFTNLILSVTANFVAVWMVLEMEDNRGRVLDGGNKKEVGRY